jgi:hypothetical protein
MAIPFLGQIHLFDWDEINFAEAAREMVASGDWFNVQINFEPFWEKPPLFIWIQATFMTIFGVSEFSARLPNVIIGLLTLFAIYRNVNKRYGENASLYSTLLYIGSFTPYFYFKTGIIDPLFNLFIFLSLVNLVSGLETKKIAPFFFSGLTLGLAVITKGPVSILLVGLTGLIYQLIYKNNFYSFKELILIILGLMIFPGLFFGTQVINHGWWFLNEFIIYQIDLFRYPVASHGQPFYYHFVVLLIGCFPLFIFCFSSLITKIKVSGDLNFIRFMHVIFWVVLIVFSLVTTKIVHYSSMCYIPLSIIGGIWISKHGSFGVKTKLIFIIISSIWAIIYIIFSIPAFDNSFIINILNNIPIQDVNVQGMLQTEITWSYVPFIIANLFIFMTTIVVIKNSKEIIIVYLITNTFIISVFVSSVVPSIEKMIQGNWITHLKSYDKKPYVHFTYGFKSYAHYYYTKQKNIKEVQEIKDIILNKSGYNSIYELDQNDKKVFSNQVRDYIVNNTDIPFTISAKISKFNSLQQNYPNLIKVFDGNGYGVWERSTKLGK